MLAGVTDGKRTEKVNIYHWWPGRTWKKECPIPFDVIAEAEFLGTRYLTYVDVTITGHAFWELARCTPGSSIIKADCPSKKLGREIALGRLRKRVESHGFQLISVL